MLLAGAVALSGLMTAGPAFAGTSGGHHGHDHFRSQVFKIELNSGNAAAGGTVWAFGPIRGTGTDQQVNGNLDVFTFPKGSVSVAHWAKSHMGPTIDYRSCTATYSEDGTWKIKGGTHKYWGAEGSGRYHLTNFVVLKRLGHDGKFSQANTDHKRGRCDTNPNDEPRFSETTVIAIGVSSVRDHDRDHKQAA
jgi:hypothetical protein